MDSWFDHLWQPVPQGGSFNQVLYPEKLISLKTHISMVLWLDVRLDSTQEARSNRPSLKDISKGLQGGYKASGKCSASLIDFRDLYVFVEKLLALDMLLENWDDGSIARGVSRRSRNNYGLNDKCLDFHIANAGRSQSELVIGEIVYSSQFLGP